MSSLYEGGLRGDVASALARRGNEGLWGKPPLCWSGDFIVESLEPKLRDSHFPSYAVCDLVMLVMLKAQDRAWANRWGAPPGHIWK
jgi:hypothetical protein